MKHLLSFFAIALFAFNAKSQNVGIGTTTPLTILDVNSKTQGVLLPRVTTVEMNAITPAYYGSLVINTDSAYRLFMYSGGSWKALSFTEQNTDTALLVHKAGTETIIGAKTFTKDLLVNGMTVGTGTNNRNVIIGLDAYPGSSGATNDNVAIGAFSLNSNTTGDRNVAIGTASLFSINGSSNNTIGVDALAYTVSGSFNEAHGNEAGLTIADGVTDNAITNNSVYIGAKTKAQANNQTNQIVIGYNATGLGSNTAIIGSSSTTTVGINGNLRLVQGMGTAPASASSPGTLGDIIVTATFIYVCTATNTWVRSALTSW